MVTRTDLDIAVSQFNTLVDSWNRYNDSFPGNRETDKEYLALKAEAEEMLNVLHSNVETLKIALGIPLE